jgi:MFS family permease
VERTGQYRMWPIAGGVLMTVGVGLLATLGVDSSILLASAYAGVLGTGIGCVMQTTLLALQNRVEASDMGLATSTILVARTLGGTVGTALFGAVLAAGLPDHGAGALDFADALPTVFMVAVPFGVISFLGALRLQEHPLRDQARYT